MVNAGTLKKHNDTLIYKKRVGTEISDDKRRVTKMVYLYNDRIKDKIQREYEITKHIEYLGMKPPVILQRNSGVPIACLTMNRLKGKTLFDFISNDLKDLTTSQCIDLSIELLEALDKLHRKGIIHRDITENIHILINNGKISIYICDFDLSKFVHESDIEYHLWHILVHIT